MGKPITTIQGGICFAFPNVCLTQVGPSSVPIPYPSIGQIADATGTASDVLAGGSPVVTTTSSIGSTTGDSAGQTGVKSQTAVGGSVSFTQGSQTVFANGAGVVRMFDRAEQNSGNAIGVVLSGVPQVLVGD